ncbi:MAG: hypothetical protein MJ136_05520, partial [Clostridia bacterium]|nr:hypothetical protein [Clostridia bacterium]
LLSDHEEHQLGEDGVCPCGWFEHVHVREARNTGDEDTHNIYCASCGAFLVGGVSHEFDENGVCTECGYSDAPVHTHVEEVRQLDDADCHFYYCSECGEFLYDEEHTFEGTVCTVCGYNNCEHTVLDQMSDLENHWFQCEECGEKFNIEPHTVEDFVCTVCYQLVCTHEYPTECYPNGDEPQHTICCTNCNYVIGYGDHLMGADGVCIACGWFEHEHEIYATDGTDDGHLLYCRICEICFGEEYHTLDDDGVCTECGWSSENECAHDGEKEYWNAGDEGTHYVGCAICGELLSDHEEHQLGEDGVCPCGWYEHEHVSGARNNGDEEVHSVYCSLCGAFLYGGEPHQLDADGVCEKCGWFAHEHESEARDEGAFDKHGLYCTICGVFIGAEEHTFDADSVCTECGWYYCPHEEGLVEYEVRDIGDDVYHERYCPECGRGVEQEKHTLNAKGVCEKCGYTSETHEEENDKPDPKPEQPVTEPAVTEEEYEIIDTETLTESVEELIGITEEETENADVTVEIVNVAAVLDAEEMEALSELSATEQVLTVLSVLGIEDAMDEELAESGIVLSEEATALKEAVLSRIAAMTEEEQEAFWQGIAEAFATRVIVVDGEEVEVIVVELKVVRDGVESVSSFGLLRTADGVKLIRF